MDVFIITLSIYIELVGRSAYESYSHVPHAAQRALRSAAIVWPARLLP